MHDASTTVDDVLIGGGARPRATPVEPGLAPTAPATAPASGDDALAALWRRALLCFAVGFAALVAIDLETVLDLIDGWGKTGTYAHGYIIFPVAAWLIWRDRARLATVVPRMQPLALVPLVACGAAWVVGRTTGVHAPEQYAFVLMVPCLVWALFGDDVTRRIVYPLAFLLFAVPAGDFLMPTLMDHTADFTVQALRWSGVPVFREGNYFQIPSGNWSVVEACSGLRYLIASLTLGVLFAYLNYRSGWRRFAFIVASLLVPIVANWLRAYMIVMLAHVSSNKLATGVDHLIYGWLFFGLVMMLLFWVGNFWRDDDATDDVVGDGRPAIDATTAASRRRALPWITAAFVALVAPWPAVGGLLESMADAPHPGTMTLSPVDGWTADARPFTTFAPHYVHARSRYTGTFGSNDREVNLFVGYYSGQMNNGLMVTYENDVVLVTDKVWGSVAERKRTVDDGLTVVDNEIKGDPGTGEERLLTWRWYWINGRLTTSKVLAKGYNAIDKLTGRGDDSAVIVLTTPVSSRPLADAQQTLEAFAQASAPRIAATLAAVHDQARR